MRTHFLEHFWIPTLLTAMAVGGGCTLEVTSPSASSDDLTGADAKGGDATTGDPTGNNPDGGDPTGDSPTTRVATNADPTANDTSNYPVPPDDPGDGGKIALRQGIIIPAYLLLNDPTGWGALTAQATAMQDAGAGTKDFWVAVNGPGNAPYVNSNDWTTAASLWDPVRAHGGAIFGYVHACDDASKAKHPTYYSFRPIGDVENEIDQWVSGYPQLAGIWIDEFYPRYEIADSPASQTDPILLFPNGRDPGIAPTDQTSYLVNNNFNGQQVTPDGGYFQTLTAWIHTKYGQLRIIGNAGGQLYSNQRPYADLVDVLCSFEDTAANAMANNRLQPMANLTVHQLALFHSTPASDWSGALSSAFSFGYSHVYATDQLYQLPDGTPGNPWGKVSSYLDAEVPQIAQR